MLIISVIFSITAGFFYETNMAEKIILNYFYLCHGCPPLAIRLCLIVKNK
jgi:hypothetical protein